MASLPSPLDSLESSKMKSMEKPPKKKDAKKSAMTAKSAPACSHVAVIQSNQSRVELENQSPKKVTKPQTTKRKRTSDKKPSEGEDNFDMASQTQHFFFPFSASSRAPRTSLRSMPWGIFTTLSLKIQRCVLQSPAP